MSTGTTTRRAFLCGAVVLAAGGAGAAARQLPGLIGEPERFAARLHVRELRTTAAPPAFGSLLPDLTEPAALAGDAHDRRTGTRVGRFTATLAPGTLHVHTLELDGGTIVALGATRAGALPVAGGTGRFERARGTMTINPVGSGSALDLDVELSL